MSDAFDLLNKWCGCCGQQAVAQCNCDGGPQRFVSAGKFAAIAVSKHTGMSDVWIAEKYGIADRTVGRARKSTSTFVEVEKRVGRDGRARKQPKRKREVSKEIEIGMAKAVEQGHSLEATAEAFGFDSVQPVKIAVAYERGRQDALADPPIDPASLSRTAQEKLELAIRQHQKALDAKFEDRVQSEIQRRVKEMVYPRLQEREKDADRIVKARGGVFTLLEYNAILRCLHPDMQPSVEQKSEAVQLWHENKICLVPQKEDPRQYPSIPTIEELMARRGRVN